MPQFTITEAAPGYWRITFLNPPTNMLGPQTVVELDGIITKIESAADLKVVVFDSALEGFFLGRYDISAGAPPATRGSTGLPPFLDFAQRLEACPVVSVALVRGRARGGGSELALACDLRFASIEKAIFGQPEVGAGFLPGGGAIERLSEIVGRARALEIILSSDDFDATTAEKYGWINRALPDAELDPFVDALAKRLASFDAEPLRQAKRLISRRRTPALQDLRETVTALLATISTQEAAARGALLRERAGEAGPAFERELGRFLAP